MKIEEIRKEIEVIIIQLQADGGCLGTGRR